MLNRRITLRLIFFLNLLLIVIFVLSSIYVESFISTQINEIQGFNGQGLVTIPYVEAYGFTVSISHIIYYENGTVANLGTLPTTIPNYPFYVFWISISVNLILIALVLRSIGKVP
jgi:hypothetical protein